MVAIKKEKNGDSIVKSFSLGVYMSAINENDYNNMKQYNK